MVLNAEIIMTVVTTLVTYIFGLLAKKYQWIDSEYIPIQNGIIGILVGIICYLTGLTNTGLIPTIILSMFGSMAAGGTYDLAKSSKIENEESEG